MAKRNLADDINALGNVRFLEYKVGERIETQARTFIRGRRIIMRVETEEDRRRLQLTSSWGVRVVRLESADDEEVTVIVALVATNVNIVTTPRQERRPKHQVNESVDLGKAPRERGIEGPNVLLHVTKAMREAAQAQARMASAVAPTRGQVVALPKKKGGKKG